MILLFIGLLIVQLDIGIEVAGREVPLFPSFFGFALIAYAFFRLRKGHSFFRRKDTLLFDLFLTVYSLAVMLCGFFGVKHAILLVLAWIEMFLGHRQLHLVCDYLDEEKRFSFKSVDVCRILLVTETLIYILEFFHIETPAEILEAPAVFLLGGLLLRFLDQIIYETKKA